MTEESKKNIDNESPEINFDEANESIKTSLEGMLTDVDGRIEEMRDVELGKMEEKFEEDFGKLFADLHDLKTKIEDVQSDLPVSGSDLEGVVDKVLSFKSRIGELNELYIKTKEGFANGTVEEKTKKKKKQKRRKKDKEDFTEAENEIESVEKRVSKTKKRKQENEKRGMEELGLVPQEEIELTPEEKEVESADEIPTEVGKKNVKPEKKVKKKRKVKKGSPREEDLSRQVETIFNTLNNDSQDSKDRYENTLLDLQDMAKNGFDPNRHDNAYAGWKQKDFKEALKRLEEMEKEKARSDAEKVSEETEEKEKVDVSLQPDLQSDEMGKENILSGVTKLKEVDLRDMMDKRIEAEKAKELEEAKARRLEELKQDLEEKRKIYIQTKKEFEKRNGILTKIGRIFSRKEKGNIESAFYEAEVDYREARAEYVGAEIEKALEEQIKVVDAQVEEEIKTTKIGRAWQKTKQGVYGFYKKLGDLNISETSWGKRQMEKAGFAKRLLLKIVSVRSATYVAAGALGTVTGGVSLILAGGLRGVGAHGGSYEIMERIAESRRETKGLLKDVDEGNLDKLSTNKLLKKMRAIEGVCVLDGEKLTDSKYFSLYKKLAKAYEDRLEFGEYGGEMKVEELLDNSMKQADFDLENYVKDLKGSRVKRKVAAAGIGVLGASGILGDLVKKAAGKGWDALKSLGITDKVSVEAPSAPEIVKPVGGVKIGEATGYGHEAIETTPKVEMTPEKFAEDHYDSLVHKGEGVTHVLQRDLHSNPEHISAYDHIKGVKKIIDAHDGDFDKITNKELNRAAWLIENDKVKGFGQEVLIKGPDDNVAVVFDEKAGRYVIGTLDDSDINSRIYSKLDIKVETKPTIIEEVGDGGAAESATQVPEVLQGDEIKNFYPSDNGFNVILPDGRELEGYKWEALNPRGGEIGNTEALMSGDAQLSAGEAATFVESLEEVEASESKKGVADATQSYVSGETKSIDKSINVPFTGKLPEDSVYENTQELLGSVEKTEHPEVSDVSVGESIETKTEVVSITPEEVEEDNLALEREVDVESDVDPEVQEKYERAFLDVQGEFMKDSGRFRPHSLVEGDPRYSSNLDKLIRRDFMKASSIKSSDKELIDLMSSDSASDSKIHEAVKEKMLDEVAPNFRDEAELLLGVKNEDGLYPGGSNAMIVSTPEQDYFIFDKDYTFSKNIAGDKVAIDNYGKEHIIDIDLDENPPKVSLTK